ncbi:glycoside hydrolase family 15 protein [Streptomyces sp. NPDC003077]|uniref:glycoside hydrolase family 15 protein n=1 Tax=Streptomyces sp. NPDC003077 TaxID=3154443 RepID=UPI0033AAD031
MTSGRHGGSGGTDTTGPAASSDPEGTYPPLRDLAFLSDCRTAALVGPDGTVEWLCAPRFDAPSVFARLLDRRVGGGWELSLPDAREAPERRYAGPTMVLETRWTTPDGEAAGYDFLAARPPGEADHRGIVPGGALVRWVRCVRGRVRVRHRVDARPDYARRAARWAADPETGGLLDDEAGLRLTAASGREPGEAPGAGAGGDDQEAAPVPVSADGTGVVTIEATLHEGESLAVELGYDGAGRQAASVSRARRLLEETLLAWRRWRSRDPYQGYGAEHVGRSALVLRGLMASGTGALIAAPTTSLPEWPGGERNWDYRYVWHRDAALVILVLLRLGHRAEAGKYLRALLGHCTASRGLLTPMLGIDGRTESEERTLDHLEGYRGSRPVRHGNSAYRQHQLDVYGQVLDAALVYQQVTDGTDQGLGDGERAALHAVVDTVCRLWREPDHGIWEIRNRPRHWTSSKLYAWVCLDRGIRLAELTGDTRPPLETWRTQRAEVRADLLANGHDGTGAFVQSYGAPNTDASLLRLSLLGFLDGKDPRMLATIDRVEAELGEDGWLVHRYDPEVTDDGLAGPEGGFLLCSFDMVSALVLAGRRDEARRRFDALCARAGPLGLYAEEMTADGTMLGNHPQAFTHLGLIEAAMNLDGAEDEEALHSWASRGERSGG